MSAFANFQEKKYVEKKVFFSKLPILHFFIFDALYIQIIFKEHSVLISKNKLSTKI